jgi:hypothetical protein
MTRRPATQHFPGASYPQAYDAFYCRTSGHKGHYRRDLLPDPSIYYNQHLEKLVRGSEWTTACCPFHADRRPSLAVNLIHGGFICHACGARGGDVLEFHRRLTGAGFIEAAKALGAWEGP